MKELEVPSSQHKDSCVNLLELISEEELNSGLFTQHWLRARSNRFNCDPWLYLVHVEGLFEVYRATLNPKAYPEILEVPETSQHHLKFSKVGLTTQRGPLARDRKYYKQVLRQHRVPAQYATTYEAIVLFFVNNYVPQVRPGQRTGDFLRLQGIRWNGATEAVWAPVEEVVLHFDMAYQRAVDYMSAHSVEDFDMAMRELSMRNSRLEDAEMRRQADAYRNARRSGVDAALAGKLVSNDLLLRRLQEVERRQIPWPDIRGILSRIWLSVFSK